MEWTQFFILIITLGGLFFWNRSEANSDRRQMALEMKDFHGRLCIIEERYYQLMTKMLEKK
jgi:hypothetical protein